MDWVKNGCVVTDTLVDLGDFAKLRQVTISFFMSVRPSVHMEQLSSHWMYFDEI
jgi:hypothetical protein